MDAVVAPIDAAPMVIAAAAPTTTAAPKAGSLEAAYQVLAAKYIYMLPRPNSSLVILFSFVSPSLLVLFSSLLFFVKKYLRH